MSTKDAKPKNALLNEEVTFIQNALPGFHAGQYKLSLSQILTGEDKSKISEDGLDHSVTFAVQGDRFKFAHPNSTVYSVFPGDNSSGAYEAVLPNVVMTQKLLPWLRMPTLDERKPTATGEIPTWMTVLVLDETDVAKHKSLKLDPVSGVLGDLFLPKAYGPSTLGDNYSYFDGVEKTDGLEPGEAPANSIDFIDIPLSFFWEIAPTLDDLALMAHVREVKLKHKPTIPEVSDVGELVGTFSVVFGNRMAQKDVMSRAYLVSLEGLARFLPTDENGGAPKGNTFDGSKLLRLAVLKCWRYRATSQPAAFVNQVQALNSTSETSKGDKITTLHLDYDGENEVLTSAFSMGYVPLNSDMRTGEKTISWYRGPLAPLADTGLAPAIPIASPDAATIFDPTTGMFDMSYAMAWTLGRQISLQDTSFSVPLYEWKKGVQQKVFYQIEAGILEQHLSAMALNEGPHGMALDDNAPFSALYHSMINAITTQR